MLLVQHNQLSNPHVSIIIKAFVYKDCCVFLIRVVVAPVHFEAYQSQHGDVLSHQLATASSDISQLPANPASRSNPPPPANAASRNYPPPLAPRSASLLPKPNAVVNGRVQPYHGRAAGEPPLQIINS